MEEQTTSIRIELELYAYLKKQNAHDNYGRSLESISETIGRLIKFQKQVNTEIEVVPGVFS